MPCHCFICLPDSGMRAKTIFPPAYVCIDEFSGSGIRPEDPAQVIPPGHAEFQEESVMKKMICCIAMFLFSLLAACAYADVTAGNIIPFGSWHQESAALDSSPVLWRVLEVRGDRALLLSDKALDARPYDLYRVDAAWDTCTLRAWLNTEFLSEAFTPDQQKAILVTTLDNGSACPPTEDKLFLLNYPEARRFLPPEDLIAQYTLYAAQKDGYARIAFSWTREPDRMINMLGTECPDPFLISNNAVRPAMWVSLSAMADPGSAQAQDFTPPTAFVPQQPARETPSGGTVCRCLLLRGPQWGGLNARYGFMLTGLMPDDTVFYPEAGFPETSGPDVRAGLDEMARLADDDDVTYIVVAAHGEPDCYSFYRTTDYFSKAAYQADDLFKTELVEKAAAIRGRVIILSLSCYSGTLADYCGPLDPARYSVWMSCGRAPYFIGSTEKMLYNACTAVRDDASGMIELGEIAAFDLRAEDSVPCVYGNPENPVFPARAR